MGIDAFTSVRAQMQVRLSVLSRVKLASKYVAHIFISRISQYMKKKGFSEETTELMSRDASKNTDLLGKIIAEEGSYF